MCARCKREGMFLSGEYQNKKKGPDRDIPNLSELVYCQPIYNDDDDSDDEYEEDEEGSKGEYQKWSTQTWTSLIAFGSLLSMVVYKQFVHRAN